MSENFIILPNMNSKDIRYMALNRINDFLHLIGHDINEYKLVTERIKYSLIKESNDCLFERNITVRGEDLLLLEKLNTQQRIAYSTILNKIFFNKFGALFIDGSEEIGTTLLYRASLDVVRSKRFISFTTKTSGFATLILPRDQTVYSHFKVSIEIDEKKFVTLANKICLQL